MENYEGSVLIYISMHILIYKSHCETNNFEYVSKLKNNMVRIIFSYYVKNNIALYYYGNRSF